MREVMGEGVAIKERKERERREVACIVMHISA